MKKLKFKTFGFDSKQVLTRAQLKRIMGGVAATTFATCGTCSVKTVDGNWHTVNCDDSGGQCACPDGLQCSGV